MICVLLCAGMVSAQPTPEQALAAQLHRQLATLLYAAGCLDPLTGKEQKDCRRPQRRRHDELWKWFVDHGRSVGPDDCRSDLDQRNYAEFREVMANRELLGLAARERRRFIAEVLGHFEAVAQVGGGFEAVAHDPALVACLNARAARPPQVRLRYFGRSHDRAVSAIYHPPSATIYLNLNMMQQWPSDFVDAFEHELWHHLLPFDVVGQLPHDLWIEGFIEVISELWSEHLHARLDRRGIKQSRTVEYPVISAYATLYLAMAPKAALRYLSGLDDRAQFVAALLAGDRPLARQLGEQYDRSDLMPPARQLRVEALLHAWGWTEDDGGRVTIAKFVAGERLAPAAVLQAFRDERPLLLDLIRAVTVIDLQDLLRVHEPTVITSAAAALPPHLRQNLVAVVGYATAPERPFRYR